MNSDFVKLTAIIDAAMQDNGDYGALHDYGMAMPPAVARSLIANIEQLTSERDQLKAENEARIRQVARALDEAEALRPDAERFRFVLQSVMPKSGESYGIFITRQHGPVGEILEGNEAVAAIDAARSAVTECAVALVEHPDSTTFEIWLQGHDYRGMFRASDRLGVYSAVSFDKAMEQFLADVEKLHGNRGGYRKHEETGRWCCGELDIYDNQREANDKMYEDRRAARGNTP